MQAYSKHFGGCSCLGEAVRDAARDRLGPVQLGVGADEKDFVGRLVAADSKGDHELGLRRVESWIPLRML